MNLLFIGDCRTILEQEDSPFGDASDMAYQVENATETLLQHREKMREIFPKLDSFGLIKENLCFGYDPKKDIHYFFEINQD